MTRDLRERRSAKRRAARDVAHAPDGAPLPRSTEARELDPAVGDATRSSLPRAGTAAPDIGESRAASLARPTTRERVTRDWRPEAPGLGNAPGSAASVAARVLALSRTPNAELKAEWRRLFGREPPPFHRGFLERRLAYRIQELAFGGLKPSTLKRLQALGETRDGGDPKKRGQRANDRPIAGTRLVREWKGVLYTVTVHTDDFEWEGRRYRSLSMIARKITGGRWNGWVFFGLRNARGRG